MSKLLDNLLKFRAENASQNKNNKTLCRIPTFLQEEINNPGVFGADLTRSVSQISDQQNQKNSKLADISHLRCNSAESILLNNPDASKNDVPYFQLYFNATANDELESFGDKTPEDLVKSHASSYSNLALSYKEENSNLIEKNAEHSVNSLDSEEFPEDSHGPPQAIKLNNSFICSNELTNDFSNTHYCEIDVNSNYSASTKKALGLPIKSHSFHNNNFFPEEFTYRPDSQLKRNFELEIFDTQNASNNQKTSQHLANLPLAEKILQHQLSYYDTSSCKMKNNKRDKDKNNINNTNSKNMGSGKKTNTRIRSNLFISKSATSLIKKGVKLSKSFTFGLNNNNNNRNSKKQQEKDKKNGIKDYFITVFYFLHISHLSFVFRSDVECCSFFLKLF